MTNEEMLSVAEIVERLVARFHKQADDHEAKMVEHRAAFGARTEADAKIIAGLRAERDGLQTQVQDMRAEMERLKSQTPKHPVKVGEWVRRLVPSPACGVGTVAKVVHVDDDTSEIEYDVKRIDGQHGVWFAKNCEPCAPPTEATHAMPAGKKAAEAVRDDRKIAPKPGDTVRLVRIPSRDDVSSELKTELEWPWIERWGTLNQTALVVEPAYQLDGALSVCLSTNVHVRWPISCIEVITEATHDTEAGKAAAERAAKTYPVEIKVGDLVEVVSNRGRNTWLADVGSLGTVTSVEEINDSISVCLDDVPGKQNALAGYVSLCDVRKVTT